MKKLVALTNRNGLYVSDEGFKLIGQESAYVFRDGKIKELKVGEFLK